MSSREANESSYRNHLQRLINAGQLSDDDRVALENDRMYLKISPDRAKEIEIELTGGKVTITVGGGSTQTPGSGSNPVISPSPDPVEPLPPTDTTLIPPPDAAKYLEHLEKYGQKFLEAQRSGNFYLNEETREQLQKLAKEFELSATDVRNIEQRILAQLYLNNDPPPPPPPPTPDPPVTKLDPQIEFWLEEIAGSLKLKKLQEADLQTFELLLKVLKPAQSPQPWLDDEALREAIRKFGADRSVKDMARVKDVIRKIDQLWRDESDGKFGFTPQLEIYGDNVITQEGDLDRKRPMNRAQALSFSKQVGWWIRGLEFLKYYRYLDFSMDAPVGHLPARWFWGIPHQENFLHGGLRLLPERGGCGMDAFAIPAFMYILSRSLN